MLYLPFGYLVRIGDDICEALGIIPKGLPQWLSGKESVSTVGDGVSSLDWKDPWRRTWQPTPGSCLGNLMDRGAWWAAVHGVAKSQT